LKSFYSIFLLKKLSDKMVEINFEKTQYGYYIQYDSKNILFYTECNEIIDISFGFIDFIENNNIDYQIKINIFHSIYEKFKSDGIKVIAISINSNGTYRTSNFLFNYPNISYGFNFDSKLGDEYFIKLL